MLNKTGTKRKTAFTTATILLLVIASSFTETESTESVLNNRIPHPPTSRPPDILSQMAMLKPPPKQASPQIEETPMPVEPGSTAGDLSGYLVFMAGALMLFRRVDD
ncbi:MAG: hypothetical protein V3V05_05030 [Pontiella sp.]